MEYLRTERARWALTLALFGLFMQIFVPLAQAISIGDSEDGFPNRMVICTLYGVKVIDITTGKNVPDSDDSRETCPVCMTFSIGTNSLGGSVELPVPLPFGNYISNSVASETVLSSQLDDGNYAARAPPHHG